MDKSKLKKEIWNFVKHMKIFRLCVLVTFVISGLMINFIQLVLYLTLRPISKQVFTRVMSFPVRFFFGQVAFLYEYYSDSTVKYYVDPEDWKLMSKEKVFFLANHHYEIDWVITIVFTDKIDTLGYCRAFIKKMLEYVPVVGWFWKLSDYIALERSFDKDKVSITKRLSEILQTTCPIMLLFFAEGTRLTQEKLKYSIEYAEERNLKPLKYHLFPRTRGFKVCLPLIKKHCDCIVNYEMLFEEDKKDVTVVNLLKGKKFNCHSYIKRIPMSEVPDDEAEAEKFLYEAYREKDEWAESFFKNKNFVEVSQWKPKEYESRWWIIINQFFWMTVVMMPIIVHFVNLLLLGLYYNFLIKFLVIGVIVQIFMQKSLSAGNINESSNYGKK